MKKIFARTLSLFIAMILISQTAVFAETEADSFVKGKPGTFMSWAWLLPAEEAQHNVHQMFYVAGHTGSNRPDDPEGALANLAKISAIDGAKKMKTFMEKKPEGGRVVMPIMQRLIMDPNLDGTNQCDNFFWWDAGIEKNINYLKELIYHYKRLGGPEIDGFIFDYEISCSAWALEWDKHGGKTLITDEQLEERYQKIVDDPRYLTDVRPDLEALGFEFYEGDDHNELYWYWMHDGLKDEERKNFEIGLFYANVRRIKEMNKIADYLLTEYPNAKISNYGDNMAIYNPDFPIVPGIGASEISCEGRYWPIQEIIDGTLGDLYHTTHQAPVFYQYMYEDVAANPDSSYPYDTFKKTPFNSMFKSVLDMQASVKFSDAVGIGTQPWIMTYSNDMYIGYSPLVCTDYFKEYVFHLSLLGSDPILYFNADAINEPWAQDDLVFSKLLSELDVMVGFEDRKPEIPEEYPPAYLRYALSGMSGGGRTVWRITPDLYCPDDSQPEGTVTMESFLIDRERPTFKIANQFVKFPEGSYIYEPENAQSEYGYWVVSPLGTRPEEYVDESLPAPKQTEYTYVDGLYEQQLRAAAGETVEGIENTDSSTADATGKYVPTKSYRDELGGEVKFPDIIGHWCEKEMMDFVDKGILEGENGLLVPDRQVTKAEFLAMLERGLGVDKKTYTGGFDDVSENDWYADIIQTAVDLGYIQPDNGKVYPEQLLSRQEMAEIVCRALPELESGEIKIDFTDYESIDDNAKEAVSKLVSLGIIKGYPSGEFKPEVVCTRAETVIVLKGLFSAYK